MRTVLRMTGCLEQTLLTKSFFLNYAKFALKHRLATSTSFSRFPASNNDWSHSFLHAVSHRILNLPITTQLPVNAPTKYTGRFGWNNSSNGQMVHEKHWTFILKMQTNSITEKTLTETSKLVTERCSTTNTFLQKKRRNYTLRPVEIVECLPHLTYKRKTKFHYAIWFEPASNQLRTS